MTVGGSIALIVLGAILYFAVEFDLAGLDINVIGVILMLGGLIGLIVGLVLVSQTRSRATDGDVVERRRTRVVDDRDL
ncbi:MAG: hypothetical protein H0V93_16705 [Euzebyales bacterium]|jgi:hypothetical protein|nr:hypothetical protein [Euzebyales bacterium]